jgi:outer membrane receptor for Fe3+-dicitrate
MQIRNQQLSVMATQYGFGRAMVNAGRSYSCGIEASLRGSALDGRLYWGAAYGYTHAVFKEYIDSVKVDGVNTAVDYKDKRVPYIPEHTFSLMADYHFGKFVVGANVVGQGKTWWDEANTYSQKFYATLGAHVDYDFGPAVVSLWGRNLTDTNYNTFAVGSAATGSQLFFAHRADPLQVGLDVRLHF